MYQAIKNQFTTPALALPEPIGAPVAEDEEVSVEEVSAEMSAEVELEVAPPETPVEAQSTVQDDAAPALPTLGER